MRLENYPPQEPLTEIGARYHAEVMRRGLGLEGVEIQHGGDPYQSLVLFPSPEPSGEVLCLIHGGGWTSGYKEWMAFMPPALTARGVTVASLGYRLAPAHVWPACFEDVADGVAAVRVMAADHGGDPDQLFVGGHSAGGHLASLLTLRRDWQAPRGLSVGAVRGALPISGTYLFGEGSGLSMRPRFLGDPARSAEGPASPMTYVAPVAPPFLIAWGEADFPHLRAQGAAFAEALGAAGVRAETLVIPGADHLGASYASGEAEGPWVPAAIAFMRGV